MDTPSDTTISGVSKIKFLLEVRGLLLLFVSVSLLLSFSSSKSFAGPRFVPGQILIKPRASVSETNFIGKLNRHGAVPRRTIRKSNIRIISVEEAQADVVLTAFKNDPEIEFAERDYVAETTYIPNDPLMLSGSEWHLARIQAPTAWDLTTGSSATVIAVLDSGVNAAQADLAGQILPGYDFVNSDSNAADDFGHGTAVAGTMVANGNNASGVAGVAFGCRVLPVKVVDTSGFATYSAIAQGIRYAADSGARVINLSIAGGSPSATLQDAVNYAWSRNVVIVASAGNNGNHTAQYPAACDHVIAVSATEPDDSLASFSSYGNYVLMAAPGDNIWTTQREAATPYGSWRGTSFASPIVAGVAALVISENPSLSNTKVVSILEENADDLGVPGYDSSFGFGRVNAFRAVTAASLEPGSLLINPGNTNILNPSDTQAPSLTILDSPKNNARLLSPAVMLTGMAADNVGIQKIEAQVNGAVQAVSGTTHWNAQLTLTPGLNVVRLFSFDGAGNISAEVMRIFNYVWMLPAKIQVQGAGMITPNLDGMLLEVGKVYSVKATPAPGQAFAGWSGVVASASQLSFTMQPDLALVAKFVPSPFPAVNGNYAGLLSNTNSVVPDNSGGFNLTVTASGGFTGKLALGGSRFGFRGQFDLNGHTFVTINRALSTPLILNLQVDLVGGSDQVTGEVTDGAWVSELSGDRNVFSSRYNPAQQAGSRAFLLEPTATNSAAVATGSSRIAASGITRVKGRLSDGRVFSVGSLLAKNGDCPLYIPLNRGGEIVIGWLNFPASSATTASGTVLWVRAGTNSFAATLRANSLP